MAPRRIKHLPEGVLHTLVRARFIMMGTTLSRWCNDNGICRPYADKCLKGQRKGDKAQALVSKILSCAGITE